MKSLEEYLAENWEDGTTEFRLVATLDGYHTTIMIHPMDKDGETVDFDVDGNQLGEPFGVTNEA